MSEKPNVSTRKDQIGLEGKDEVKGKKMGCIGYKILVLSKGKESS